VAALDAQLCEGVRPRRVYGCDLIGGKHLPEASGGSSSSFDDGVVNILGLNRHVGSDPYLTPASGAFMPVKPTPIAGP